FGTTGEYYDSKIGPNWFDYYFLPVSLGGLKKLSTNANKTALHWLNESQEFPNTHFIKTNNDTYHWLVQHHPERLTNREEIIALWSKYVHVRPEIEHQIQQFVRANFESNFVIGIHYRGTDKSREAPRTKYEKVTEEIKHQVALRNLSHYKIFVATDEQAFVSYLESEFPNKIMYLSDTERSKDGKPLHLNKQDQQYKIGKAALLDSLLLSKTDLLIRTSSNLSRWSTYFNPDLPVIELSKRH
ncbi:MAG: nodulation protein NodZ, partial [Myxococcaceae bacterium]